MATEREENTYRDRFKKQIDEIIEKYSVKTAITYFNKEHIKSRYSYGNLSDVIDTVSKRLEEHKVSKGCRVAVISSSSPFGAGLLLSLAYLGYIAVLIDPTLPVAVIEDLVNKADVSCVFAIKKFFWESDTDFLCDYLIFEISEDFKYECIQRVKTDNTKSSDRRLSSVIAVLFSSGTTGQMKGVEVTYQSILLAHKCIVEYTNLTDKATFFDVLPLNHIAGYSATISCLLTGAEIGFISEVSSSELMRGFRNYNPTNFIMIPKVYELIKEGITDRINRLPFVVKAYFESVINISGVIRRKTGLKLHFLTRPIWSRALGKNIKICGCGTAPCEKEIIDFFLNLGIDFVNVYGSTETGFPVTAANCHDKYPDLGAGRVDQFDFIKIKIINPDKNGEGEIAVKTPLLMKGYLNDISLTKDSIDEEGYFHTGDLGFIDVEKNLFIKGRIKDNILLKNGEKISPFDVEYFYGDVCKNTKLAACGIKNQHGYDELHVFVERRDDSDSTVQLLFKKSRQTGGKYRIGKIHVIDCIPVTATGKIKRFLLKTYVNDSADITPPDNDYETVDDILMEYLPDGYQIEESLKLIDGCGFDSLTIMEISLKIERIFDVRVIDLIDKDTTINDLKSFIEGKDINRFHGNILLDVNRFPKKKSFFDILFIKRFAAFSRRIWKLKCYGMENIPQDVPYMICANHESHFDLLWIVSAMYLEGYDILQDCCCMGAEYVMKDLILGRGFKALGGIPVDRDGNAWSALRRANSYLKDNTRAVFMIHPEGTRTRDGNIGKFKKGAAEIALESGRVMLPVRIVGAREVFPPDNKMPVLSGNIKVYIQLPVIPENKTIDELTDEISDRIKNALM